MRCKAGDRAQITLPGNNLVTGKVDRLGRVAQIPAGQDNNAGGATIPAYIILDHPEQAHGLDQATVQLEITTRGVENALSVPVTSIVGSSGGGSGSRPCAPAGAATSSRRRSSGGGVVMSGADQRSELNAARSSNENSSGSSQAAKWPPLSTSWK